MILETTEAPASALLGVLRTLTSERSPGVPTDVAPQSNYLESQVAPPKWATIP